MAFEAASGKTAPIEPRIPITSSAMGFETHWLIPQGLVPAIESTVKILSRYVMRRGLETRRQTRSRHLSERFLRLVSRLAIVANHYAYPQMRRRHSDRSKREYFCKRPASHLPVVRCVPRVGVLRVVLVLVIDERVLAAIRRNRCACPGVRAQAKRASDSATACGVFPTEARPQRDGTRCSSRDRSVPRQRVGLRNIPAFQFRPAPGFLNLAATDPSRRAEPPGRARSRRRDWAVRAETAALLLLVLVAAGFIFLLLGIVCCWT